MKLVYQCDYCSTTGTKEEIELHEKECCYREDMKMCQTCEHRDWTHCYSMSDEPSCEINGDYVKYSELPGCPKWVLEK